MTTAAELFEIVKDTREVWDDSGLEYNAEPDSLPCWTIACDGVEFSVDPEEADEWKGEGAKVHENPASLLPERAVELILEALYARATGCGVVEHGAEEPRHAMIAHDEHGEDRGCGPSRLSALVAAYKEGVRAA